jgi:hypothetical protein
LNSAATMARHARPARSGEVAGPVLSDDGFDRHVEPSWDYSSQAIDGVLHRMKMELWGMGPIWDDDEQAASGDSGSTAAPLSGTVGVLYGQRIRCPR